MRRVNTYVLMMWLSLSGSQALAERYYQFNMMNELIYHDNVGLVPDGLPVDIVQTWENKWSPSALFGWTEGAWRFEQSGQLQLSRFTDEELNSDDAEVVSRLVHETAPRTLSGFAQYTLDSTRFSEFDTTGIIDLDPTRRRTRLAGVSWTERFNEKLSLGLTHQQSRARFDSLFFSDYQIREWSVMTEYVWSPRVAATLTLLDNQFISRSDTLFAYIPNPPGPDLPVLIIPEAIEFADGVFGVDSEDHQQAVELSGLWQFADTWQVKGGAGRRRVDSAFKSQLEPKNDSALLIAAGRAREFANLWQLGIDHVRPNHTWSIAAERSLNPSGVGQLYDNTRFYTDYQWQASDRWFWHWQAEYRRDVTGIDISDGMGGTQTLSFARRLRQLQITSTVKLNEHWQLQPYVRHQRQQLTNEDKATNWMAGLSVNYYLEQASAVPASN